MPDDIYAIPAVPRALSGKARSADQKNPDRHAIKPLDLDSLSNPDSLQFFVDL